jgi:hypothetical protein
MLNKSRANILDQRWLALINNYSQLKLTLESDRLMALMGIVVTTQEVFNDEHVAGLWKSQLLLDLHGRQLIATGGLLTANSAELFRGPGRPAVGLESLIHYPINASSDASTTK